MFHPSPLLFYVPNLCYYRGPMATLFEMKEIPREGDFFWRQGGTPCTPDSPPARPAGGAILGGQKVKSVKYP